MTWIYITWYGKYQNNANKYMCVCMDVHSRKEGWWVEKRRKVSESSTISQKTKLIVEVWLGITPKTMKELRKSWLRHGREQKWDKRLKMGIMFWMWYTWLRHPTHLLLPFIHTKNRQRHLTKTESTKDPQNFLEMNCLNNREEVKAFM